MSANLAALNPEWVNLASKVAGALYSPGSAADVTARTAQNRADLGVETVAAPPTVAASAAPGVTAAKSTADDIQKKYFTAPAPNYDATVKAAALTNIGATPPVTVNQGTAFNPTPLTANAPRGDYTSANTPGAVSTVASAPAAAPTMRAPAMNEGLLSAQQNIMRQIGDAQSIVSAGSNRDGYKMGDVTKALMTMNALNPTLNSVNGLLGQSYGADASMFNHAADNVARTNIATAHNAAELEKTHVAGGYGVQKANLDNQAALGLAERKFVLDENSSAALAKRAQAARDIQDHALVAQFGAGALKGTRVNATDAQGRVVSVNPYNQKDVIEIDPNPPATKKGK